MDELKVFTGNAHPTLAKAVVDYLDIPLGKCEVFDFSNEKNDCQDYEQKSCIIDRECLK